MKVVTEVESLGWLVRLLLERELVAEAKMNDVLDAPRDCCDGACLDSRALAVRLVLIDPEWSLLDRRVEPTAPLLGSSIAPGRLEIVDGVLLVGEEPVPAVGMLVLARAFEAAVAVAENAKLEASEVCVQSSSKEVLCSDPSMVAAAVGN